MTATTLVISPHLDDAILSIGGSIAAWSAAGHRVVVATVYTTGPALVEIAPSMRVFADYANRRAENTAACAVVGAEERSLDQVERAFRRPFLTDWNFFSTPGDRAGFARLDQVTKALAPLASLDPDQILVPLGIGNHVDHVEASIAATDWALAAGLADRVRFYEDFYAISRTLRRAHPIASRRQWRLWQAPLRHARRLAVVMRTIAAARRGPPITELWASPFRTTQWTVETTDVRGSEDQQLAAIECYRSQTRAFGGFGGIARAIRALHAWWGGEPLWQPAITRPT
jgi:LmbE family N-acetylglucosaminyl deacetylase